MNQITEIELLENLGREIFINNFTRGVSEKIRGNIGELLANLFMIPRDIISKVLDYLLCKKNYMNAISGVLLSNIAKEKQDIATEIYEWLINEPHTARPREIIDCLISIYGLSVKYEKNFFGKNRLIVIFPQDIKEKIAEEKKFVKPKKNIMPIISNENWNKFVKWNISNEYSDLKDDTQICAYGLYWYNENVLNGGHLQFFYNRQDWDFKRISKLFEKMLSKELFMNFTNALAKISFPIKSDRYYELEKSNIFSENDEFYDDGQVQIALEKIASKVIN